MITTREFIPSGEYLVTHSVDPKQTGARLDNFLKARYRKRSRQVLQRAIEEGSIYIERNQGPHLSVGKIKPSTQLIGGDDVIVVSERKPEPPVCFDYSVLYEDEVLFVVGKPANLPVHPAGRYFFNTLLVQLRSKMERDYFLIHRIDKETSGVLLLAKERTAAAKLVKQFADRKTQKHYLAIVKGTPPEEFAVDAPIGRSQTSAIELKMAIIPEDQGGATAQTHFKRLETHGAYSLVACYPKTGRQHQIRLHLEHYGFPIVGDKLYGMPEDEALGYYETRHVTPEAQARLILPRHALHACTLTITHPLTQRPMEFHSPLPQDLRDFLNQQTVP